MLYYIIWPWCNGYGLKKWTRRQTLGKADCLQHNTNILEKGKNPIIHQLTMVK